MRNLDNVNDTMLVLADAEQPVRTILADETVKELYRDGTYLDLLMYLVCHYRDTFFEVVAAVDGEVDAEGAKKVYDWKRLLAMVEAIKSNKSFCEIVVLFFRAGRKKRAVSSGSAPENTVE